MPLQLARAFSTSTAIRARATSALLSLPSLVKDADHALAREWLDNLDPSDIPKDAYDVSYARSSGPGGQHVNKTNSKAVVRLDLHKAKGRWLPPFVVPELQKTVSVDVNGGEWWCSARCGGLLSGSWCTGGLALWTAGELRESGGLAASLVAPLSVVCSVPPSAYSRQCLQACASILLAQVRMACATLCAVQARFARRF
jgi:hypothetical protein